MSAGGPSCTKESSVDFANEHPVVLALWILIPAAIILVGLLADRRRRRIHASARVRSARRQQRAARSRRAPFRSSCRTATGAARTPAAASASIPNFGSSDTGGDFSGGGGGER